MRPKRHKSPRRACKLLWLRVKRPSIARSLASQLILQILIFALILAGINHFLSQKRADSLLQAVMDDSASDLGKALALPLWTFNEAEVNALVRSYALTDAIAGISVFDDEGTLIAQKLKPSDKDLITRRQDILRKNEIIGHVVVQYTGHRLSEARLHNILLSAAIVVAIMILVVFLTPPLLRRYLTQPLKSMSDNIKAIAKGDYEQKMRPIKQEELRHIPIAVNTMAKQIQDREQMIAKTNRRAAILEAEMEIARTIQEGMLAIGEDNKRAGLTYYYEPMEAIGGDWFMFFGTNDDEAVYAIMGDVSGHGIPQALITGATLGGLRSIEPIVKEKWLNYPPSTLIDLVYRINREVLAHSKLTMTVVAMRLERATGRLVYCNAGHTFPLVFKPNGSKLKVRPLELNQQNPIGTTDSPSFIDTVEDIDENDMICLYTDGLTEARDNEGRTFARKLLRFLRNECQAGNIEDIKQQIINQLKAHAMGKRNDDICVTLVDTRGQIRRVANA